MELDGACFCAPRAGEAEEAQAYEFRARTRGLTLKRGEPPTGDSARFLEDPGEFSGVSVVLIETSEAQAEA
jgi:hypothetical protein